MIRNKTRTNGHVNGNARIKAGLDELTGVWNRPGFVAAATPMFVSCQRRGAPIALAYFDFQMPEDGGVDQATVERVLMAMAEMMRKAFRSSDIIGRVGKLRFAVLLPDCTKEALAAVEGVRALNDAASGPGQLSLAAGMVRSAADGTLDELMRAADVHTREIKRAD